MSTLRPRATSEQAKTKQAVEFFIAEVNNQDDAVLVAVLRQLYEESLHYHVRADLLDALMTRNMTEQQEEDFVSYVEATRKKVEAKGQGESQRSFRGSEAEDGREDGEA